MSDAAPHVQRDAPFARVAHGWAERRTYRARDFPLERIVELKQGTRATGILPAREVAGTIGAILDRLAPLRREGALDDVVVVDSASADGTAEVAARHGATVLQEDALLPEFGPARGKGDAMWRAVAATGGDLVLFLDADTEEFDPAFALGMLGPLLAHPALQYVKGAYRRPFRSPAGQTVPEGGGRVSELTARPFLNLFVPELAGFAQPLAGEVAARRPLLESLPFAVGYGVEIGMLIDTLRLAGLDAMAQADLGSRQNRHQPLRELTVMASAVLATATRRVGEGPAAGAATLLLPGTVGELEPRELSLEERPPLHTLRG